MQPSIPYSHRKNLAMDRSMLSHRPRRTGPGHDAEQVSSGMSRVKSSVGAAS
eukprot:SAG11_NODE_41259_length_196_cov_25.721649_1_plen_51_part_10